MAIVQRANVLLTVPDTEVDKYIAKGYSVLDASGNVIKQHVPTELIQLQKAYSDHVEQIKQLTSEIARLKSQLAEVKNASAPLKGDEATEGWDDWSSDEEVKPKKKASKK